jgi:hypothetical protein
MYMLDLHIPVVNLNRLAPGDLSMFVSYQQCNCVFTTVCVMLWLLQLKLVCWCYVNEIFKFRFSAYVYFMKLIGYI